MVNERDILDYLTRDEYKPLTHQELEKQLQVNNGQEGKDFVKLLDALEGKGLVIRDRTERYGLPERMNLIRGRMQAHAKGFGFLIPEDREHPDVYINASDMNGTMNGDTILVRVTNRSAAGGKLEGEVVLIVTRAINQVVGVFQNLETYGFVLPDDKRLARDIFVPKDAFMGAVTGQKVVARIVNYPEGRSAAEAEIVEILGHKDDPGVDILSIIRQFKLPESFTEEVLAEAELAPDTIKDAELVGRRDLRGETIVTIDGADAKDLDDAVNVKRLENGNYYLGVHIADVSYYVRESSELDKEAYSRGTSVYLVDRVIPMLPHRLSNGICSLHPQVDRLTMSCEMEIDEHGNVIKHDIFTSVIRTVERMTYTDVRKIVEKSDPEVLERYKDLVDNFLLMEELALLLRGKRMKRGAVDFNFQEAKIIVDETGKPTDIVKRERSIAEQIIEEFMLKANETVAEHFYFLKVPFLYRVHEEPDSEKLLRFAEFITAFGYALKGGPANKIHPRSLQTILEDIKGTKEEAVISTVLLRSMKQARYDSQALGHFGLSADFYSHFTSPIRRYPDLIIHRVIREVLEKGGALSEKRTDYLASRMDDYARQSSERERIAVEAERETDALKKAEFMLDKVGEEFEGIISGVTGFGMFIELSNTVEGLIRMSDLTDDFYNHHEAQHMLVGERTGRTFRLGDEIKVRVVKVNVDERNIDFELLDMKKREGGFARGRAGGDRGGRGKRGDAPAFGSGGRGKRGGRDGGRDAVFAATGGRKRGGKGGAAGGAAGIGTGARGVAAGSAGGGASGAAKSGTGGGRGKGGARLGVGEASAIAGQAAAGGRGKGGARLGAGEAGAIAGQAAASGRKSKKRKQGGALAATTFGESVLAGAAGQQHAGTMPGAGDAERSGRKRKRNKGGAKGADGGQAVNGGAAEAFGGARPGAGEVGAYVGQATGGVREANSGGARAGRSDAGAEVRGGKRDAGAQVRSGNTDAGVSLRSEAQPGDTASISGVSRESVARAPQGANAGAGTSASDSGERGSKRGPRRESASGGFAVGPNMGQSGKASASGAAPAAAGARGSDKDKRRSSGVDSAKPFGAGNRRREKPGVQFYGGAAAGWATSTNKTEDAKTPARFSNNLLTKALITGRDLIISGSGGNVNINGDVYAFGTLPNSAAFSQIIIPETLYGGIIINGPAKTVNIGGKAVTRGYIKLAADNVRFSTQNNVICDTLFVQGGRNFSTASSNLTTRNIRIDGNLSTFDDVKINGSGAYIYVGGNYYGLNEGSESYVN
ncbi:MAG: ribonuclease R, partial [Gorillibacterium sp.]|nr:ribonuclease R [Gorillibacterium sp.]